MERYKDKRNQGDTNLAKKINWSNHCFTQSDIGRCSFLQKDNLCKMYLNYGENMLCDTCRMYPRHIEEFENVREYSLSISCPEVVRMLLEQTKPLTWVETNSLEQEEPYGDFDSQLYEQLLQSRRYMLKILQNRHFKYSIRCWKLLCIAHHLQMTLDSGKMFKKKDMEDWIQETYPMQSEEEVWQRNRLLLHNLLELEALQTDWQDRISEIDEILFAVGAKDYTALEKKFDDQFIEWPHYAEQLTVYFIDTYFCGAVYDNYVYAKVQGAVVHVLLMKQFLMAKWKK